MKTELTIKREVFGVEISKESKSEFFSATDLVKAGNKWRRENGKSDFNLTVFMNGKQTKEFLHELESSEGFPCYIKSIGIHNHTWVHPLLFIDMALAINPNLNVGMHNWLFDHLIKNRNLSIDSYKKMIGRLYFRCTNKRDFPRYVSNLDKRIKLKCNVDNWDEATDDQISKRDSIHYDIALFSDALNNNDDAVTIALQRLI